MKHGLILLLLLQTQVFGQATKIPASSVGNGRLSPAAVAHLDGLRQKLANWRADFGANPEDYRNTTAAIENDITVYYDQIFIQPAYQREPLSLEAEELVAFKDARGNFIQFELCQKPSSEIPMRQPRSANIFPRSPQVVECEIELVATVFDSRYSLVQARYEGNEVEFWCNVDFNLLDDVDSAAAPGSGTSYSITVQNECLDAWVSLQEIILLKGASSGGLPELPSLPTASAFGTNQPKLLSATGHQAPHLQCDEIDACLEALLAHYSSNEDTIKREYIRNEALRRKIATFREDYRASQPKKRVVQFYPTVGSVYLKP
ncbi:MAG: hypothetical protein AAFX93_19245 [Verrucomicrobiota bacterium]